MKRKMMKRSVDRKVFKKTAKSMKSVNVSPTIMRGGFRL